MCEEVEKIRKSLFAMNGEWVKRKKAAEIKKKKVLHTKFCR